MASRNVIGFLHRRNSRGGPDYLYPETYQEPDEHLEVSGQGYFELVAWAVHSPGLRHPNDFQILGGDLPALGLSLVRPRLTEGPWESWSEHESNMM